MQMLTYEQFLSISQDLREGREVGPRTLRALGHFCEELEQSYRTVCESVNDRK